jgi:hypothetical protein
VEVGEWRWRIGTIKGWIAKIPGQVVMPLRVATGPQPLGSCNRTSRLPAATTLLVLLNRLSPQTGRVPGGTGGGGGKSVRVDVREHQRIRDSSIYTLDAGEQHLGPRHSAEVERGPKGVVYYEEGATTLLGPMNHVSRTYPVSSTHQHPYHSPGLNKFISCPKWHTEPRKATCGGPCLCWWPR